MTINAFEIAAAQVWALLPEWLSTILEVAAGHGDVATALKRRDQIQALETQLGDPLDGTHRVRMRDGVAVLPVRGPIFRYANLMTAMSGATSTEILARDFDVALNSARVHSIVLNIDSPGGVATGINEFGQQIFNARGKKPITAYIGGLGASAGYWIASSASDVVIDDTGEAGSIGVVMAYRDTKVMKDKAGIREIEIVSSVSPNKRPDPDTPEGLAELRQRVDAMAAVFVDAVARNRGVTVDTVLNNFGRGGILVGAAAVKMGLADRLGSLESVIAGLVNSSNMRGKKMSTEPSTEKLPETQAVVVSTTPELIAAIENGIDPSQIKLEASGDLDAISAEVSEQATSAERARVLAILDLHSDGVIPEIRASIESGHSVGDAATALLKAARERGATLADMAADARGVNFTATPSSEEDKNLAASKDRRAKLGAAIAKISAH